MGVQADTATAIPGVLLDDADGFTEGDPQAGIAPTQISPTFLNSLITELNGIVEMGPGMTVTFGNDVNAWRQACEAIIRRIAFQEGAGYADMFLNPPWSRRTYGGSGSVEHDWRTWFRDSYDKAAPQATVQTTGHLVLPDDSVFRATFVVNVVRSDDIIFLKTAELRASCRRTGGACYVDKVTLVDDFGALGATFTVIPTTFGGEPAVAVETTLPASVGHTFNIAVSAQASNVTIGT